MGKGSEVATRMGVVHDLMTAFPGYILGKKQDVNEILTAVDSMADGAKDSSNALLAISREISDHMGMLAQFVDSDSATWAGWSTAQSEVDSGALTAFAPLVTALDKVHGLLMAVNGALDEAAQVAAGGAQAGERALDACQALTSL